MIEAKHGMNRDCLGFKDFRNFDGVKFSYKRIRIVTLKLKEKIEIDQLIGKQHFEFKGSFHRANSSFGPSIIEENFYNYFYVGSPKESIFLTSIYGLYKYPLYLLFLKECFVLSII